jgi:hypothetical protein
MPFVDVERLDLGSSRGAGGMPSRMNAEKLVVAANSRSP